MNLTVAVPTGRMGKNILEKMKNIGLLSKTFKSTRKLDITDQETGVRYIFVKPSDVITYVNQGVADIGVVGKDTILEERKDIYELLDLKLGVCDFVIAGLDKDILETKKTTLTVATKYPLITKAYFKEKQRNIKIIKLNGSVELAPLVGLSDVIVDITETGETLRANNLEIIDVISSISARLICNKVSYRFKKDIINDVVVRLEENYEKNK